MKNGAWKLNEDDVRVIKDLIQIGKSHQSIGDMFNVSREHIWKIANNQRWSEINNETIMEEKPIRSNDLRDFGDKHRVSLPIKKVELVEDVDQLDLDQKYYLVKFIESLTGKKIKKLIVKF